MVKLMSIGYVIIERAQECIHFESADRGVVSSIHKGELINSKIYRYVSSPDAFVCGEEYMRWCLFHDLLPELEKVDLQNRYGRWCLTDWMPVEELCFFSEGQKKTKSLRLDELSRDSKWVKGMDSSQAFYVGCLKSWVFRG